VGKGSEQPLVKPDDSPAKKARNPAALRGPRALVSAGARPTASRNVRPNPPRLRRRPYLPWGGPEHGDHRTAGQRMPVLFIGHGNPMNALERNEYTPAPGSASPASCPGRAPSWPSRRTGTRPARA